MKVWRFFVIGYFLFGPLFGDEATPKDTNYIEDILRMTGTLFVLLLFIALALFFCKKMVRSRLKFMNRSTSIKILERRALHAKASLYLIEVLGKTVLISEAQGQINLIAEIDHPIPLAEEVENPPKVSFTEMLKNKINLGRNRN